MLSFSPISGWGSAKSKHAGHFSPLLFGQEVGIRVKGKHLYVDLLEGTWGGIPSPHLTTHPGLSMQLSLPAEGQQNGPSLANFPSTPLASKKPCILTMISPRQKPLRVFGVLPIEAGVEGETQDHWEVKIMSWSRARPPDIKTHLCYQSEWLPLLNPWWPHLYNSRIL